MVGERRQCDADRPPEAFRKNAEYEYDGAVFSVDYAERSDLFEGLSIWQEEKYRQLQGTYPVIALSFAKAKGISKEHIRKYGFAFCGKEVLIGSAET